MYYRGSAMWSKTLWYWLRGDKYSTGRSIHLLPTLYVRQLNCAFPLIIALTDPNIQARFCIAHPSCVKNRRRIVRLPTYLTHHSCRLVLARHHPDTPLTSLSIAPARRFLFILHLRLRNHRNRSPIIKQSISSRPTRITL